MERKLIGKVGVDSGQLLIIDPDNIERHWQKDSESNILGVEFWGAGKERAIEHLQTIGYDVLRNEADNGYIYTNEEHIKPIQKALVEFLEADFDQNRIVWNVVNDGTYQEVSKLTRNEERYGQLKDTIACAFESGFGDGVYEVYATYKDSTFMGMSDKRISKVEIILIEQD